MHNNTPKSSRRPTATQLDRMQQTGRLTPAEAAALNSTEDDRARDGVLGSIRARHIAARLAGAVDDGRVTAENAQTLADRARAGEHGRELRVAVNKALKAEPKPAAGGSS
jgi:hypothetical protein